MQTSPPRSKKPLVGRHAARLAAVQALYQIEQTDAKACDVVNEFITFRFVTEKAYIKPDISLFRDIVTGASERRKEIDDMISAVLSKGWRLERLETVARAILRAGTFELLKDASIPVSVLIDEYVAIATLFFFEDEPAFIHGALDSLAKTLRGNR